MDILVADGGTIHFALECRRDQPGNYRMLSVVKQSHTGHLVDALLISPRQNLVSQVVQEDEVSRRAAVFRYCRVTCVLETSGKDAIVAQFDG